MDTSATVRPLREADLPRAQALWKATPGVGLSRADELGPLARFLQRNPGASFAAECAGELVGTVLCGHDGRRGLIHHLVVDPRFRRTGLARTLLRSGLDALRGEGIDKCHLLVFRDNTNGLAFWRALAAQERTEIVLFSVVTDGGD